MAIRDYLLTKLRLKADEQQRALDIERQRAQTEADIYNAQVKAAGDVAGTATKLISMGASSVDEQAAKDLEDMDLQAKVQAARDAELTQSGGQLDRVTGQVVPAATSATKALFPDQPVDPSLSGGVTRRDSTGAVDAFKSASTPVIPAAGAVDGLLPADDTRRPGSAPVAPVSPALPAVPAVEMPAGYRKPLTKAEAEAADAAAFEIAYKKATSEPYALTNKPGAEPAEPIVPETAADRNKINARESIRRLFEEGAGEVMQPAAVDTSYLNTVPSGIPGLSVPVATPKQVPSDDTGAIAEIQAALKENGTAQQAPAEPATVSTGTAADIPDPVKFQEQTGINVNKPAVAAAVIKAADKVGYKPLTFEKAASPQEEAKKIVDQVWKKQPPGNPLTAFFNHGKNTGQMDQARRMAELKVELTIRNTRKELQAAHEANYLSKLDVQTKEAQIDFIRARSVLATANADKVTTIKLQTKMSDNERKTLREYDTAQRSLSRLAESSRDVLDEGKGFPIGANRKIAVAMMQANEGKQGSRSVSIGGGTGVLGGGSLSIGVSKSGRPIDSEVLEKAFNSIDKTGWTDTQLRMHNDKLMTIQSLGKALEGGKLTDADYVKYVETLFNDDPQVYLMNVNQRLKDFNQSYGNYYSSLEAQYEKRLLGNYSVIDPSNLYFSDEDIARATAAPISQEAARLAADGASYSGPDTAVDPLVTGVASEIMALANKLSALEASGNTAAAAAVKAEIAQKSAAVRKPTQPRPRTQTAADPFN